MTFQNNTTKLFIDNNVAKFIKLLREFRKLKNFQFKNRYQISLLTLNDIENNNFSIVFKPNNIYFLQITN